MKEKLKEKAWLKLICYFTLTLHYNYIKRFIFYISMLYRKYNIHISSRYRKLHGLKNKYLDKRCFIIANGPSLTIQDCEKLKNEYTFGMNALIDIFENTTWRPTFYGIQDCSIYNKVKSRIENNSEIMVFLAGYLESCNNTNFTLFPLCFLNHRVNYFKPKYLTKFSDNAYVTVYDGYSITYSLIQLAVYLGFKDIYLLGCDCNFIDTMQKSHFVGCNTFGVERNIETAAERNIVGYSKAYDFIKNRNINITNCTRGGKLEIFPRESLEVILNREK